MQMETKLAREIKDTERKGVPPHACTGPVNSHRSGDKSYTYSYRHFSGWGEVSNTFFKWAVTPKWPQISRLKPHSPTSGSWSLEAQNQKKHLLACSCVPFHPSWGRSSHDPGGNRGETGGGRDPVGSRCPVRSHA